MDYIAEIQNASSFLNKQKILEKAYQEYEPLFDTAPYVEDYFKHLCDLVYDDATVEALFSIFDDHEHTIEELFSGLDDYE